MTRTGVLLGTVLALSPTAQAASEDSKKDGSDPAQALNSPFQVGNGATLLVKQDKKSLTAAITGQLGATSPVNVWQLGVTGTTDDEGKSLVYSTSETAAPGFKAKVGFGYSSFMTTDTAQYRSQARKFLDAAWCLDVVASISRTLPAPMIWTPGESCLTYLEEVQKSLARGAPADADAAKAAKVVLDKLSPIAGDVTPGGRQEACKEFKTAAKEIYNKLCLESGAIEKSPEDRKKDYPDLYEAKMVAQLPSFYYTLVANYTPTLASAPYRDVADGVADLATKHQWTELLHGASLDAAFYYRRFAAGVSVGYFETTDIKLASVCKVTTTGDYRAELCKDAMLGKPEPKQAYSVKAVLALDPLLAPQKSMIARPGAQLELYYEHPAHGAGYKYEIAAPLFLAPLESPLKLVVGVRPTWTKDTTGDDRDAHFGVLFFIGARPGIGR